MLKPQKQDVNSSHFPNLALWGGASSHTIPYILSSDFVHRSWLSLLIVKDGMELAYAEQLFHFFAPHLEVIVVPAWDSHPFEHVSPDLHIAATRTASLIQISQLEDTASPTIVLTTIRSLIQKIPSPHTLQKASIRVQKNAEASESLRDFLSTYGFERVEIVRNAGEYAIRGNLIDVFPPASEWPIRFDFFGDEIETLQFFDPVTQMRLEEIESYQIFAASELQLTDKTKQHFRKTYLRTARKWQKKENDQLLDEVQSGIRTDGIEYWLGYFYEELTNLLDFLRKKDPKLQVFFGNEVHAMSPCQAVEELRHNEALAKEGHTSLLFPEIDSLHIEEKEWHGALRELHPQHVIDFQQSKQPMPEQEDLWLGHTNSEKTVDFTSIRNEGKDVYKHLVDTLKTYTKNKKAILIAFDSEKTLARIHKLIQAYGLLNIVKVQHLKEWQELEKRTIAITHTFMETGFALDDFAIITQRDILGGERKASRKNAQEKKLSILDANVLQKGEIVVHQQYGIGRYAGIENHTFDQQKIACLRIHYQGGDSILLPVYNLDLLSRYGEAFTNTDITLDKLGGTSWQARKLKAQKRIQEMAEELLKTEAIRKTKHATSYIARDELYYEFCTYFPHVETPDQEKAEEDIISDLAKAMPMDRLICGDVGFGKTEIALRAAFIVASRGDQVALITPTTLLAHQHYRTAKERFDHFNLKVALLSRFVPRKTAEKVKEQLLEGEINIIIGTQALLSKSVEMHKPGLVILDEEQLFGVAQKEKLKRWNAAAHILSMSATPIPRTLQMSLSGVRDISIIATPPVNRHAIRTYIAPESDMTIRRAILDEMKRNGQIYYISPRIKDLDEISRRVTELVPQARIGISHAKMSNTHIEDTMLDFINHNIDILIATPIVGAGIDVANANTMIVHRSNMFGLAQLYQLRGRIGRSHNIAHCYLFLPKEADITDVAKKRLEVIRTNDALGTGFNIANHDLDIRGAGNLLGSEQSGQIREVGTELYQKMLAETIAHMEKSDGTQLEEKWSAQVRLGFDAFIPEEYIPDMSVRLQLYNRLNECKDAASIAEMKHEFQNRFGTIPKGIHGLLHVMAVRLKCNALFIEKLNAHQNGCTIKFRPQHLPGGEKLLQLLYQHRLHMKTDPQHQIIASYDWSSDAKRLRGVHRILDEIERIVVPATTLS